MFVPSNPVILLQENRFKENNPKCRQKFMHKNIHRVLIIKILETTVDPNNRRKETEGIYSNNKTLCQYFK